MAAMDLDREPIDAPTGITELPAPAQRRDVQQPAGPRRWLSAEDVQVRSLSAPLSGCFSVDRSSTLRRFAVGVQLLLAAGDTKDQDLTRLSTHIDAADEQGWTLLMHAAERGLPATVAALLGAAADAHAASTWTRWPRGGGVPGGFPRGSTALSIARALVAGPSDTVRHAVVTMLSAPERDGPGWQAKAAEPATPAKGAGARAPPGPPKPLISVVPWLPASALPKKYRQWGQHLESPEEIAERCVDGFCLLCLACSS